MDKQEKLSRVITKLEQLAEFLRLYLPLANVHNTNFIVSRHWDKMIPEGIGQELLQLSDCDLSLLPAGELYYCESGPDSFDCHTREDICTVTNSVKPNTSLSSMPDLITSCSENSEDNSGNTTHVKETATRSCGLTDAGDERCNSSDEMTNGANVSAVCHTSKSGINCDGLGELDHSPVPNWQHQSVKEFIMAAVSCTLPQLGLLTSVAELSRVFGLPSWDTASHVVVSHAMKVKKSHEVDIMSNFCAWLAKGFSVSNVSCLAACTVLANAVFCLIEFIPNSLVFATHK